MEHSFSKLFFSKTICSHTGTFVLGNEWSIDLCFLDRSFPGTNEPWTFRSSDHSFTGTFIPNYKKVVKLFFSADPGLVVPKSSSIMGTVIYTSAGCSISGATSVSGRDSTSGIAAELRSLCTCD